MRYLGSIFHSNVEVGKGFKSKTAELALTRPTVFEQSIFRMENRLTILINYPQYYLMARKEKHAYMI